MNDTVVMPTDTTELRAALADHPCVLAVGNQTKSPLCRDKAAALVSLGRYDGIIQYEPSEYTFTARAGTLVSEIVEVLAARSQYMPFDPLLVESGATIGGTVAAGLSGPGRFRYGGLRDFLLAVQFLTGDGTEINAGGKVVKNAAGFDLPKFFVGSMGRFGVLTELTFKVFPRPERALTMMIECASHDQAIERMTTAASERWELDAVDYRVNSRQLAFRVCGPETSNMAIADEIGSRWQTNTLEQDAADDYWSALRELRWASDQQACVKIPTTPSSLRSLLKSPLGDIDVHVSAAGNLVWASCQEGSISEVDETLTSLRIPGLVVRGQTSMPQIGFWSANPMNAALRSAMDPSGKFPSDRDHAA